MFGTGDTFYDLMYRELAVIEKKKSVLNFLVSVLFCEKTVHTTNPSGQFLRLGPSAWYKWPPRALLGLQVLIFAATLVPPTVVAMMNSPNSLLNGHLISLSPLQSTFILNVPTRHSIYRPRGSTHVLLFSVPPF